MRFYSFFPSLLKLAPLLVLLQSCASKRPEPYPSYSEANNRPTLTVWGFTCEVGSKKCNDRKAGREMRDLVTAEMSHTGKFRSAEIELKEKKHMQDMSDMLWSSGEPDVLQDLIEHGKSDYLMYGRVLEYDKSTRMLIVELSLVRRDTGQMIASQGKGSSGSLANAIRDAVHRLAPNMERIMD